MVDFNWGLWKDSLKLPGSKLQTTDIEKQYLDVLGTGDPLPKAISEIMKTTQPGGLGAPQREDLYKELSEISGRPIESIHDMQSDVRGSLAEAQEDLFMIDTSEKDKTAVAGALAGLDEGASIEEINKKLEDQNSLTRVTWNEEEDKYETITIHESEDLNKKPEGKPEYSDPDEYLGAMYPDEVIKDKELTLKERLAELWADGSKRDAILGSISETLLETRYGKEAYGSRWRDFPKNVRAELQEQEALNIIKDQATLDMMKTKAETEAASNPMQYLSNTQKNARDHATAIGVKEGFVFGSKEWHASYATALENMAMENLLTGPVEGIAAINELLMRNSGLFDEATMKVFKDVIAQLTSRITTDGGVKSTSANKMYGGGTEPGSV